MRLQRQAQPYRDPSDLDWIAPLGPVGGTFEQPRPTLALACALALVLGTHAAAQTGETPPPTTDRGAAAVSENPELDAMAQERDRFLDRLRRGHWASADPFPIDSFAGALRITPLGDAARETGRVEADLKVLFRTSPSRIRYGLEEGGKLIKRGIDADGPWERDEQGTVALDSRIELKQSLRALRGHLRSARILCELLDPAVAFRELQPTGPVTEQEFRLGRGERFDAVRLTGRMERWPLWRPAEGGPAESPASVELFAEQLLDQNGKPSDRLRLRAVVIRPLVRAQGVGDEAVLVPGPRTETVLLREQRPTADGLQLPTQVYICEDVDADGPARTVPQVLIKVLDPILGEDLGEDRFRRPG